MFSLFLPFRFFISTSVFFFDFNSICKDAGVSRFFSLPPIRLGGNILENVNERIRFYVSLSEVLKSKHFSPLAADNEMAHLELERKRETD